MEVYMKKHGKGMIFTYYFHPTNVVTDGAVLNLTIHWSLAVHVTLWPSLGILSGVLLCVYTYFWKKHVRKKKIHLSARCPTRHLSTPTRHLSDTYHLYTRYMVLVWQMSGESWQMSGGASDRHLTIVWPSSDREHQTNSRHVAGTVV